MAKRTALLPASDDEVRAQLHATLAKLVEPSTAKQVVSKLAKPFKRDVGEITNMLEEAVVRGVAHRYPKGKQVRYHADPADVVLAGAIESALGDRPKTWTDLKKVGTLKKAATWVVSKELDRVRDVLLKNGRLPRWPKVGPIKSERYAKRAASLEDPADYACHFVDKFRQDLKALAKALAKSGTTAEQLDEAARDLLGWKTEQPSKAVEVDSPSGSALDRRIFEAMERLDPATVNGAAVSFARLRGAMTAPLTDKALFDETVWRLAEEGRVSMQRHDFPAGCTNEEREKMIPDRQGGYYYSVSRRHGQ